MRIRRCFTGVLLLLAALAFPAVASADIQLGTTTPVSGSAENSCPESPSQIILNSVGADTDPAYTVPSGGPYELTQWQINVGAVPRSGAQVTLVVLNVDFLTDTVTVVGTDTETLPGNATQPNDIATYTPSTPIQVQPGDAIGLYIGGATGIPCYWAGGSVSSDETTSGLVVSSAPVAGEQLTPSGSGGIDQPGAVLNLGATIVPTPYDAGVSLTSGPSDALVGQPAVLTGTVTNSGPVAGPVTFTDSVPAGLTVDAANTSSGTCATSTTNVVTCTFADLPVGQSETVEIVVTPAAAQTYDDTADVAITNGATDPNAANNSAATALDVTAPAPAGQCVVPALGGAPEATAEEVLVLLDCKVGAIRTATSKTVAKGDVISISPGAGSYATGTSIGLVVSSGAPKAKPKPKPKHKKKHKK
jgi:uncharacterized repeat protein (TIGR01451 family)